MVSRTTESKMSTDVALTAYEYDCFRMQRGLEPKYHVVGAERRYWFGHTEAMISFRAAVDIKDALDDDRALNIVIDTFSDFRVRMLILKRLTLMGIPRVETRHPRVLHTIGRKIHIASKFVESANNSMFYRTTDPPSNWEQPCLFPINSEDGSEPIWPRDRAAAAVATLLRTAIAPDLIRTIFNFLKW